jgi:hypothetical protein
MNDKEKSVIVDHMTSYVGDSYAKLIDRGPPYDLKFEGHFFFRANCDPSNSLKES